MHQAAAVQVRDAIAVVAGGINPRFTILKPYRSLCQQHRPVSQHHIAHHLCGEAGALLPFCHGLLPAHPVRYKVLLDAGRHGRMAGGKAVNTRDAGLRGGGGLARYFDLGGILGCEAGHGGRNRRLARQVGRGWRSRILGRQRRCRIAALVVIGRLCHQLSHKFLALLTHQHADLLAGKRAAQITHGPAGMHQNRAAGVVNVMHQEHARFNIGNQAFDGLQIQPVVRCRHRFQPGHYPLLILLRLQPSDKPRPGIGQPLIIEVTRVLGRQNQPQAKGARLFEQPQNRVFGGGIARVGREVTEHFINVQQCAQAGGAAEGAHPAKQVFQNQRDDKLPLRFRQVRDIKDGDARAPIGLVEQVLNIQRFPLNPGLERGRGDNIVQVDRQFVAVFFRHEVINRDSPQLLEGRLLHLPDNLFQGQVDALAPGILKDI